MSETKTTEKATEKVQTKDKNGRTPFVHFGQGLGRTKKAIAMLNAEQQKEANKDFATLPADKFFEKWRGLTETVRVKTAEQRKAAAQRVLNRLTPEEREEVLKEQLKK
jgi:hypothetical protein